VQHHVDRRIRARRRHLRDLIDRKHRVEHDLGAARRLAVCRHENIAMRLLPAAGEGREHDALGLRIGNAGEKLHRAERERARHQGSAGQLHRSAPLDDVRPRREIR
jgi:hypothetical protein